MAPTGNVSFQYCLDCGDLFLFTNIFFLIFVRNLWRENETLLKLTHTHQTWIHQPLMGCFPPLVQKESTVVLKKSNWVVCIHSKQIVVQPDKWLCCNIGPSKAYSHGRVCSCGFSTLFTPLWFQVPFGIFEDAYSCCLTTLPEVRKNLILEPGCVTVRNMLSYKQGS